MMKAAYRAAYNIGRLDYLSGIDRCPYAAGSALANAWHDGRLAARDNPDFLLDDDTDTEEDI